MDNGTAVSIAALLVAICGAVLSWLLSDARTKTRLEGAYAVINEQAKAIEKNHGGIRELELQGARSQQDRLEMHRQLEGKASRESVDGFRSELTTLRIDMDKRFDRLERLLEAQARDARRAQE